MKALSDQDSSRNYKQNSIWLSSFRMIRERARLKERYDFQGLKGNRYRPGSLDTTERRKALLERRGNLKYGRNSES